MGVGVGTLVGGVVVQTHSAPGVVRLIRGHASLKDQILRASVVSNHEEDVALVTTGCGELGQVHAGRPRARNDECGCFGPVAGDHARERIRGRNRLVDSRKCAQRRDLPCANACVPAGSKNVDAQARSRGRDKEVD